MKTHIGPAIVALSVALAPVIAAADSPRDSAAKSSSPKVSVEQASPSFGVIEGASYIELFGDARDVPMVLETVRSMGVNRQEPVIVFIDWRG